MHPSRESRASVMPLIQKDLTKQHRRVSAATTCGNGGISHGTGITYLRGESRRVRIMSFNPGGPGYEGENIPTARSRSARSSAQRFRTGNWIPLPRGFRASSFGAARARRPFEGCRKILITRRDAKEIPLLHMDCAKGLDYASYEVTERERRFRE